MAAGLFSGVSGLALGSGLYKGVAGLGGWSGGSFDPTSLFANGEVGVWFDPSDLSTLFQDAAGTTPVTAAGQSVGLVLDKSKGLVPGPELVTNGGFDTDTAWTKGTGVTIGSGVASFSATPSGSGLSQTISGVVAGQSYRIRVTISGYVSGSLQCRLTSGPFVVVGSVNGTVDVVVTAGGTLLQLFAGIKGSTFTIDNVSVREIPGNPATQATLASKPRYQTAPDRLTLDKVDDRLLVTVPTGGFVGTMVLATPEGTAAYGVNIPAGSYAVGGTTANGYFPGTAIQACVIRNGAMTQREIDRTIAYMRDEGGGLDYGAVMDFSNYWRDRTEITSFPLIDTSAGTNFSYAWTGCTSLTSFPANFFDGCAATNFDNAFSSTNLNQASIDGILVSIASNGTSNGTLNQSGGSAPSATGQAAITAMRSRGWTVTVTGGF